MLVEGNRYRKEEEAKRLKKVEGRVVKTLKV
jgi:hypothetical protein